MRATARQVWVVPSRDDGEQDGAREETSRSTLRPREVVACTSRNLSAEARRGPKGPHGVPSLAVRETFKRKGGKDLITMSVFALSAESNTVPPPC